MKIYTKVAILFLILFSANVAFAQTAMKAPVRFKLKNGVTVIVAQNIGLGKIYSRLTIENQTTEDQRSAAQVLESFLSNKANQFNEMQTVNFTGKIAPKITMTPNEANTATNILNFEQTLNFVSESFLNPAIAQQAFDEMKGQYTDNKEVLNSVTLNDLKDFYQKHFKAADTFITIAGDITPTDAKLLATKAFGNWETETTL